MERVDLICRHPLWLDSMAQIRELERDRIFCRHGVEHCLDVARLAYIDALEQGLAVPKELIYAAALLHDVGRHLQYRKGIPHDQGSAQIAETVLADCGFTPEERTAVLAAILGHRDRETGVRHDLAGLIYRADKASRSCLFCQARSDCNWSPEKKNMILKG